MHTHQVRIRLDAIDRHRGKLRRHGLRRLRFLEFLGVFRLPEILRVFGLVEFLCIFRLFERLEFLGRSDFLNFLCLALRGMLRARRFCRVERKCRREHREHQHQRQKQRKQSFPHVQISQLSFVFPAKTHRPHTSQNIFLQYTIFTLNFQPRPVSLSSRLSNLNLFRTFQFRFRFPYILRKKIRSFAQKRTAGTGRSLFLCN